jgi:uncharacterized membrane-anchored protein
MRRRSDRGATVTEQREIRRLSQVPRVTLVFWIIKIAATTLGETGGDTVSMALNWAYLAGSALFLVLLAIWVTAQIGARRFHPALYWATIVAATLFGTTTADFFDRSLGIGCTGGLLAILACLMAMPGLWYRTMGSIAVETVDNLPGVHHVFANAGLGDWTSNVAGLVFAGLLIVLVSSRAGRSQADGNSP